MFSSIVTSQPLYSSHFSLLHFPLIFFTSLFLLLLTYFSFSLFILLFTQNPLFIFLRFTPLSFSFNFILLLYMLLLLILPSPSLYAPSTYSSFSSFSPIVSFSSFLSSARRFHVLRFSSHWSLIGVTEGITWTPKINWAILKNRFRIDQFSWNISINL